MNWDQLKVVGIVPEGYPIICVEFLKASKTQVILTPAASYIKKTQQNMSGHSIVTNLPVGTVQDQSRIAHY